MVEMWLNPETTLAADRRAAPDAGARPAERRGTPRAPSGRPLVVDLDGTLVRSDLLIECAFAELGRRPVAALASLATLARGRAALKARLADAPGFDPAALPYDEAVLARIRAARAEGRPVHLASASDRRLVEAVADHLGLFAGWFASDGARNNAGEAKAEALVAAFGDRGFDYIGNDAADLPVWRRAAVAIAIRAPSRVARRLAGLGVPVETLAWARPGLREWLRLVRIHQWAKNALVLLPLLTSHAFTAAALGAALLGALAFSLCASAVYIVNDLADLRDDRGHRTKRHRPLAAGAIEPKHALTAVPLLLAAAAALGAAVSWPFLGVLAGYLALTTAYSFRLKRLMLADVVTLAGLYTVRVVGGAVAIGVDVSSWLLAFCMAVFLSLALMKRYVELTARLDARLPDSTSRDYRNDESDLVAALAAAAGFNAVTVFALYLSSDAVNELYATPELLWLAAPILLYWIARALMLARRRLMHDDPVVFALRDPLSLGCLAAIAALAVVAM